MKFYSSDKTLIKEVMVFDTNQTQETYFDKNGNKIKSTNYSKNNTAKSISGFEYDEKGNVTKETGYNQDGSIKWARTYEYNEAGKNIKESDFDSNNKITSYAAWEHGSNGAWKWIKHQSDV